MRFIYYLAYIVFFICIGSVNSYAQFTLQGVVTDFDTEKPIIAANIFIQGINKGAITDEQGQFSISLSAGQYQLTFSAVGYRTQMKTIQLAQNSRLDIELVEDIKQIDEVTVTGKKLDQNVKELQMSTIRLDMINIKKIPVVFGESDIIKVLTLQPGVSTIGEGSGGFNVRGGRVDQNLVLLDGAPLFNTSHLLGFFTSVNPDAIQDVILYKGGIPAQYGGRLSSLLAMNMRPGNEEKLKFSSGIGPISSRLLVEGPILKNKLTFIVSGRAAYPNWLIKAFPGKNKGSKAFFYDVNAKIQYKLNSKNTVSLMAYRSYDNFKFPEDTLYSWQSNLASLQWTSLLTNNLAFSLSAIHSDYRFGTEGLKDGYGFLLRSFVKHQEVKAGILFTPGENHKLELGGSSIWYTLQPGDLTPTNEFSNVNALLLQKEFANERAAYVSEEWNILPALTLQAGLRYSWFANKGPRQVFQYADGVPRSRETIIDTLTYASGQSIASYGGWEPRMAARISLGAKSAVKLSYNRTRQYLHLISNTTAISPVDFWKVSDSYVPPQIASQGAIGFFRNFFDNAFEASLETFYKEMRNLVEYKNGATLLLNPTLETDLLRAKGKAYGVELSIHKSKGKFTGQFSYTYSRSLVAVQTQFPIERVNDGVYFPSNFDRPNNLALSGQWQLNKGWTLASNFVYTTGRPATYPDGKYVLNSTPVVNYSKRNADRIPDYHRLDVSFSKDTRQTKNQQRYSMWVISFYNLYARKNPYSIYFTNYNNRTRSYRLSVFGTIIPSLTWNFYF